LIEIEIGPRGLCIDTVLADDYVQVVRTDVEKEAVGIVVNAELERLVANKARFKVSTNPDLTR
jgi:hypothetical protein